MNQPTKAAPFPAGLFHRPGEGGAALRAQVIAAGGIALHSHPVGTLEQMLQQLGKDLHLPDWYGANFDALHDCLSDPDWQDGKCIVLLLDGLGKLAEQNPDACTSLREVLRSAAELRSAGNAPFCIVLDHAFTDVDALPN